MYHWAGLLYKFGGEHVGARRAETLDAEQESDSLPRLGIEIQCKTRGAERLGVESIAKPIGSAPRFFAMDFNTQTLRTTCTVE